MTQQPQHFLRVRASGCHIILVTDNTRESETELRLVPDDGGAGTFVQSARGGLLRLPSIPLLPAPPWIMLGPGPLDGIPWDEEHQQILGKR